MFSGFFGGESAAQLRDKAMDHIRRREFRQAVKIAHKLRGSHPSGSYQIEALALKAEGQLDKAVASLLEGMKKAPFEWALHHLLGSIYSDMGRYPEALDSYDKALVVCEGDNNRDTVLYNKALVKSRQGLLQEALELCPLQPASVELLAQATTFRLKLLNALGRHEEVLKQVKDFLQAKQPEGLPERSDLHFEMAGALWLGRQDRQGAIEQLVLCLQSNYARGRDAQEKLEQLAPPGTMLCRRFALRFEGDVTLPLPGAEADPDARPQPIGPAGCRVLCQVVAVDQAEALEIYRASEIPYLLTKLSLRTCEDRGPFLHQYRGLFIPLRRTYHPHS